MRYTPILLGLGLLLAAAVAFGSLAAGRGDGAPAEAAVSAPPSGEVAVAGGAGLPDLVVTSFQYDYTGIACAPTYGITMHFANNGDAPAGPFVIDLNGAQAPVAGLGAGVSGQHFFTGSPGMLSGTVDLNNDVVESDEGNNTLMWPGFPTHTPVATCTPDVSTNTPTPSPTGGNPDGDGIPNGADNCPQHFNPGQENNDRNFIAMSPPLTQNDLTRAYSDNEGDVCDIDDDSDGLGDPNELDGALCGGISTDPFMLDTDGDGARDSAECSLLTDPTNAAQRPSAAQCAAWDGPPLGTDSDGDRLLDHVEACGYGTGTMSLDSDADGVNDGCEAVSLNGDTVVNSLDQLQLAFGILGDLSGPPNRNADLNKDGAVNSGDQLLMAFMMMPQGQCPNGGPDLVVEEVWIELETGSGCYTSTTLGTRARVRNQGNAASGPFVVSINNNDVPFSGLAPAATVLPWAPGYRNPNEEQVWADRYNQVAEKDETNNLVYRFAPIPTLPPACTATPTATPTP